MNLKEDFIAIQGIILSTEKTKGALKRIKYRGGNEETILTISEELHKLFVSKKYIKDRKVNSAFDEQLQEICLFLIFNTELKTPMDEPGFQHLINIMPQISTCLLANLIAALDLSKQYCQALLRFDLDVTEELLGEIVPVIKKCPAETHIENAFAYLNLIITKVAVSSDKVSDAVEKLNDIAAQMLLNLTGLHGEQAENIKIDSVYKCMGYTLHNLLKLLLVCDERNESLTRIVEKLLQTSCSIVVAITIDVFCCWAEIEDEGEVLQSLIAGKSYRFIEKYQKHPPAKELIGMLGNIAQKPKSVTEQIHNADVSTMIAAVNKADPNQKQWFVALLNTQVLKSLESVECLRRWAHLCTLGDVTRLLTLSVTTRNIVVIKCAAALGFEDLVLATTRHFHQNGIHTLHDNIEPQLILLFNKIKDKNIGDEFNKDLYLLILQNFEQTLSYIYEECLKNTFYSTNLAGIWPCIKEIIAIENIGLRVLKSEIKFNLPNEHNCKNYIELFNTLVATELFSTESLALNVILPLSQEAKDAQNLEVLKFFFEILKDLQGNIHVKEETQSLFDFLFESMKCFRTNFLNFNGCKQEIMRLAVEIVENCSERNSLAGYEIHGIKSEENFFVSFYKRRLYEPNSESDVLKHFFPIRFDIHAEIVAHLIKILPLCVTPEWVMICSSLRDSFGACKTTDLLCDSMVLLCELVKNQASKTDEAACMLNGLKYCLQNVGIVIKDCIQPKISNLEEDVALTKHVCRLLKEIPAGSMKIEEGVSLANLLSDMSLRTLRSDKNFACLVVSINEPNICKMLAQKILS